MCDSACTVRTCSPDPIWKGGSDEGEEKPKNRAVVMLDMEGCIFFYDD